MNLVPNEQMLLNVPFQSTKYRKKEICVDNKVQDAIADVFCPTCKDEKCVYISTNKTTSFYEFKKCKACCHVLNIPFWDQKPTIVLFGGNCTYCFARQTSLDYEEEKPFHFWKNFSANHKQEQPNLNQKIQKLFHLGHNRVDTPLADAVNQKFLLFRIFYTFSLH